jgi:hypothetical protein
MQATYTEDGESYRVIVVSELSNADVRFRLRRLDCLDSGEAFTFMKPKDAKGWFGVRVLRLDNSRCVLNSVYPKLANVSLLLT